MQTAGLEPVSEETLLPRVLQDIAAVLASCKATSIAFNPLTAPNITKALTRIADAEGLSEDPALFKVSPELCHVARACLCVCVRVRACVCVCV
jgi:hypothetical protein